MKYLLLGMIVARKEHLLETACSSSYLIIERSVYIIDHSSKG